MAKYHASKNGKPLCSQTGAIGGFHAVCVPASVWNNELSADEKCAKCVAKIKAMKEAKTSK